jgi:hypothetical protein
MRAQAELYYSNNGNSYSTAAAASCDTALGMYANTTTTGSLMTIAKDVASKATPAKTSCTASETTWVATAQLSDNTFWCVDSSGKSTVGSGPATTASTTCN